MHLNPDSNIKAEYGAEYLREKIGALNKMESRIWVLEDRKQEKRTEFKDIQSQIEDLQDKIDDLEK